MVACEIEEFMRDFAQPWFERAGVADKVTSWRTPCTAQLKQDNWLAALPPG